MTQTNDITTLRDELFKQLRSLSNKSSAEELAIAKAKNEIAQTIINSAKVEIDALKVIGGNGTGFIPALQKPTAATPAPSYKQLPTKEKPTNGGVRLIRSGKVVQQGNTLRHTCE
jgi:hypothetical protein